MWCQYERMESELAVFRSQLQHVCHYGPHQVLYTLTVLTMASSSVTLKTESKQHRLQLLFLGAAQSTKATVDDGGHSVWSEGEQKSLQTCIRPA